ncbi:hypothetical protein ACIQU5_05645 [Streptomyces sp. NPDC090306]|uniref:hypothetical protein n=1 Tax=unclassified Streptomyces TaxID=2593676 RepID=UPI0036EFAB9D
MNSRTSSHFRELLEMLSRLLLPGAGRRGRPARVAVDPVAAPCPVGSTVRRLGGPPLRGEDHALVRPYVLAYEREERARLRERARLQRARRRTLWLAVHGVDVGPRVIHGVEVTA